MEPEILDSFEEETAREVVGEEGKEKLKLRHQVRHQVSIPPGYPYVPIQQHKPDANPARVYPFTLDPFQKVSIYSIERNESVLVAAHTSAGKTVVAEYAIAQALRNRQRVIYTSPIKALSNQKYREFAEEFGDVGLMTGDVTISPNASCLVMTTEILRSMLYRGSEIVREVAWVIFDEVHYMRDKERGVIWEETLILLPDKVRYVFLSATIPNALEFSNWICKLHDQPCHVVYTDFRPTPLQHYLFPEGGDGIRLVVDENGEFKEANFEKALSHIKKDTLEEEVGGSGKGMNRKIGKITQGSESDISKIIKLILTKNYHPVIVFSFGKKGCELLAQQMSKIDFNSSVEADLVENIFNNAMNSLKEEDRNLPQIVNILPLLKRGIGIHHSGILQILKEVIELLFQEGLIKVLFATETFSIGLNMPAKTVVFTSVRKFDGVESRWITSGEYIQMSGRAGRRGLDDRGIVIMMINENMEPAVAKSMIKGMSDVLNSAFNLNYNMLLNLLRVEGITPESILENSFMHFQNQANLPKLKRQLKELNKQLSQMEYDPALPKYYMVQQQLETSSKLLRERLNQSKIAVPFLNPGRLVRVNHIDVDFGYGFVVNYNIVNLTSKEAKNGTIAEKVGVVVVDVLLPLDKKSASSEISYDFKLNNTISTLLRPYNPKDPSSQKVIPVVLSLLDGYSQIMVKLPTDLTSKANIEKIDMIYSEINKRYKVYPLLDPIKNMKLTGEDNKNIVKMVADCEKRLLEQPISNDPLLEEKKEQYDEYLKMENLAKKLKEKVSSSNNIEKMDELKCRRRILRRLGFVSPSDVIEIKGRVACEITNPGELLLTELIFCGMFTDLTVEQSVAILSCFVFDENTDNDDVQVRDELKEAFNTIQQKAKYICKVTNECRIPMEEDLYLKTFKPDLMDVVLAWCAGVSFEQLCGMTEVFEGSIIRMFRRLEELLRQMAMASKTIGNNELEIKFSEGVRLIKRDIIFAASLYL
ncbi:antiviral helicase [Neoconidiobolus thromboides FSU 785]|nr:antiviral helicase [Neoconidiobolus thromboides FSU 785]